MDRMSIIIKRDQLKVRLFLYPLSINLNYLEQYKSYLENSGGDLYTQVVIADFLYGDPNGGDMANGLREFFEEVKLWTAKDWANLLSKCVLSSVLVGFRIHRW